MSDLIARARVVRGSKAFAQLGFVSSAFYSLNFQFCFFLDFKYSRTVSYFDCIYSFATNLVVLKYMVNIIVVAGFNYQKML